MFINYLDYTVVESKFRTGLVDLLYHGHYGNGVRILRSRLGDLNRWGQMFDEIAMVAEEVADE